MQPLEGIVSYLSLLWKCVIERKFRERGCNQEQKVKTSLQNCIKHLLTSKQKQNKTCCVVVVQYLVLTLTIINIHEPETLQPLRMVKLIMLTGSFNRFIQSKHFSCNKWHNNYAHNLTRGQWQVEEWHTHLHKVQRTHLHAHIRINIQTRNHNLNHINTRTCIDTLRQWHTRKLIQAFHYKYIIFKWLF